jgi:biotin operon repressor
MVALTLGEAAARALGAARTGRRSGAPVRRGSVEEGSFEDGFYAVPAPGECDRLVRAARGALDAGRRVRRAVRAGATPSVAERRLAAITAGAVRVFEELCTLARLNRGRVYPSYDRLAERTALGRATVARAIATLEEAGFLVRQRRFRRVEGEGPGPRWMQTSNAYRPTLPERLLHLLPRWMRPVPLPADAVQREADRQEDIAAMGAKVGVSGALGAALARLGALIERESHDDPEPLPQSSSYAGKAT